MLTVLMPVLGRSHAKYLLGFYLVLFVFVLTRPFPKSAKVWFLYAYVLINIITVLIHFGEMSSILNAGSLVVSIIAIAGLAYHCVRGRDHEEVDRSLETSFWISLCVSFFISVAFTAIGFETAPSYFPWEALYTNNRLFLIQDDGVGHTPSLWVIAFLAAFMMHKVFTVKPIKGRYLFLFTVLLIFLFTTKSRLAIVYFINFIIMGLAYLRISFMRFMVFLFPLVFSLIFLVMSIVPPLGESINEASYEAQEMVGSAVRITPPDKDRYTVFAGRGLLNRALLETSFDHPLRGLGDDSDILLYGIDASGEIAYSPDKKRSLNESPLRLAVKYGWLYLSVLIVFLLSLARAYRKFDKNGQILKIGLWGMCIESIATQGGMENFYSVSALFLFVLCIFFFQSISGDRWVMSK